VRRARFGLAAAAAALVGLVWAAAGSAETIVRVGAGSFATVLPPGAREPQPTIYKTPTVRGKMPTTDWWSSLAWMPLSERQYPHPLAVRAVAKGLRVYYPGPDIKGTPAAIFAFLPEPGGDDLVVGHSACETFAEARVDGFSDWFVRAAFGDGTSRMVVSYGHGSPFVYAVYAGGGARVTFAQAPTVWSGGAGDAVLGVTVNRRHYGLFGPTGSTWTGLGTTTLTNSPGGKPYFAVGLLPEASAQALALVARYAYAHVTDTKVAWKYDPRSSSVETTFTFTTKLWEGRADGTLFALYPHQWRHTAAPLTPYRYDSVRGVMKLAAGRSFATRMTFPGVLPALPAEGDCDKARLDAYLDEEAKARPGGTRDIYWEGKRLGKLASLVPIAEQTGNEAARRAMLDDIRARLEHWFTAADARGSLKSAGLFYYNDHWGALIGYPAGYGSDTALNDHHFHYGYFIKAAAEVARSDPSWAADARWGGMVQALVRDMASPDRADPQFPFLRCFDPYAGHSWASGNAKFGDGNNQESSSEAMNAWAALVLWGEATGHTALRDLGVYLYTTEMEAIDEYWFDVRGENGRPGYTASVVTMVWGGKGANGTWFSANPEVVHGINWLPIHGGSLYLGRYPEYVRKNYDALVRENGGTHWDQWADLVWMYRALDDPADAAAQFDAAGAAFKAEAGNSRANAYHWIWNLKALGHVDRTVWADVPLYAVFRNAAERTYVVYNRRDRPLSATFSDGTKVVARERGFAVVRRPVTAGAGQGVLP